MYSKTELIYRTALTYASYKNKPTTVNDELLDEMFRDLCLLANEYENVESMIALSGPWAGSRAAKWLHMVFRESGLFQHTKPGSNLLDAISKLKLDFPISNIVSTGTSSSANALAGLGSTPNDGLLTLETQRAIPEGFTNCETVEKEVSHNELLMSMEIVEFIRDKIFNETEHETE